MFANESEMAPMDLYGQRAGVGRKRRGRPRPVAKWIEDRRKFTVRRLRLVVFGPAVRLSHPLLFWRWYNVIQHYAGAGWLKHTDLVEMCVSLRKEIRSRGLWRGEPLTPVLERDVLRMLIFRCEAYKGTQASQANRRDYETKIETKEGHARMWTIQDLLDGTCPDCGAETAVGCKHGWPAKVKVKRGPELGRPQLEVLG